MVTRRQPTSRKAQVRAHSPEEGTSYEFWERLLKIGERVPRSEWMKRKPRDAARYFDEYLDGTKSES